MKVIIYTTPVCPYCDMAKQYLKQKGVQFESIDVAADKAKALEMIKKSGQMGVPVIDIDGIIVAGFNREQIDAALEHAKGHEKH